MNLKIEVQMASKSSTISWHPLKQHVKDTPQLPPRKQFQRRRSIVTVAERHRILSKKAKLRSMHANIPQHHLFPSKLLAPNSSQQYLDSIASPIASRNNIRCMTADSRYTRQTRKEWKPKTPKPYKELDSTFHDIEIDSKICAKVKFKIAVSDIDTQSFAGEPNAWNDES